MTALLRRVGRWLAMSLTVVTLSPNALARGGGRCGGGGGGGHGGGGHSGGGHSGGGHSGRGSGGSLGRGGSGGARLIIRYRPFGRERPDLPVFVTREYVAVLPLASSSRPALYGVFCAGNLVVLGDSAARVVALCGAPSGAERTFSASTESFTDTWIYTGEGSSARSFQFMGGVLVSVVAPSAGRRV